jgi:hypothetical protein
LQEEERKRISARGRASVHMADDRFQIWGGGDGSVLWLIFARQKRNGTDLKNRCFCKFAIVFFAVQKRSSREEEKWENRHLLWRQGKRKLEFR